MIKDFDFKFDFFLVYFNSRTQCDFYSRNLVKKGYDFNINKLNGIKFRPRIYCRTCKAMIGYRSSVVHRGKSKTYIQDFCLLTYSYDSQNQMRAYNE